MIIGNTYSNRKTAEKAQAEACSKLAGMRAEELDKLREKLPSMNDSKLFYYASSDCTAIRNAAVDLLKAPEALHMLIDIYREDSDVLNLCARNANTAEGDLLFIFRETMLNSDENLIRFLLSQNRFSDSGIIELLEINKNPLLRQRLLKALREKSSFALLLMNCSYGTAFAEKTVAELKRCWPDDADGILEEAVKQLVSKSRFTEALALREKMNATTEEFEQQLLDVFKEKITDKSSVLECRTAARMMEINPYEEQLKDFAMNYVVSKGNSNTTHNNDALLNAALSRLSAGQLYEIIRRCTNLRDKERVVEYLPKQELVRFAIEDDSFAVMHAASSIDSLQDMITVLRNEKTCKSVKEELLKRIGEKEGGQDYLAKFFEETLTDDSVKSLRYRTVLAMKDPEILRRLCIKYPDCMDIVNRLGVFAESEEDVIYALLHTNTQYDNIYYKIKDLSEDGRRRLALSSENPYTRSIAASTLLDTGKVHVLKSKCRYCGGDAYLERIYRGTIEEHDYEECTECKRSWHQTIHGSEERLIGDYYIYSE